MKTTLDNHTGGGGRPEAWAEGNVLVVVRIDLPDLACCESLMPQNNVIGLWLLGKLLRERIENSGEARCFSDFSPGKLNRGWVFLETSAALPACAVVKETMDELNLAPPFVSIGYYCESELIWRCVYPSANTPFEIDSDFPEMRRTTDETFAAFKVEHAQRVAAIKAVMEKQKPSPES